MDEGPETQATIIEGNLRDFFHELMMNAVTQQRTSVAPRVLNYVTDVLVGFHDTERLFSQSAQSAQGDQRGLRVPVLADMLSEAVEADFYRRVVLLRQMGDTSLMVSGYFPEALNRRAVDLSYYRSMGELAYSQLGSLSEEASVFDELSSQFQFLSDLISYVSEITLQKNRGSIQLLENFEKTGSERSLELLRQQGIIPIHRGPKSK